MKIALAADTLMQWEGGRRFFALLLDGLEDSLAPGDILRVVSEPARDAMLWRVARVGRQILSGRATRKWVAAELSKTSKAQQIRSLVGGRRKIIWRDRAWPLAQDGFDVVGPIQRRLGWTANIGSVGYIVDMQHKFIPELFSDEELKKRDLLFQWTLDHCPVVVLNSETARTHVQQFLNVGNCRLVVLPIAAYADPKWLSLCVADVQRQYAIKEPYFICSNQFWAHKNHSVIFMRSESLPIAACP